MQPHVIIGHHPELGIVAADCSKSAAVVGLLERLGFIAVPRKAVYVLREVDRNPTARTRSAVARLRDEGLKVQTDWLYDPLRHYA
ncbi:hypothetical protein ACFYWY_36905 [Streptomyces sp. NPDC002870]|uniref:hypothetical protein n=1 Tax=Streptomyces sp. NPDC002870 TaxID=3364666 RepID=UPI00368E3C6C